MIHSHKRSLVLFLLILFFTASVHAQQDQLTSKENAELREKAFKLLESVAGQLNTLQSTENRARIGSNLVESLWKYDEERARSLLRMVQEDLRTELQRQESRPRDEERFAVFLRLRHDTVDRIAKHDPEAALEFLKLTQPTMEEPVRYGLRQMERALELSLAKKVAASKPEVAMKIARQALARGFSRDLLLFLTRMNRTHKDHAQTLYKEIVEKLRDADFPDDWPTRTFTQALVQSFRPPDADESTYRELVGALVTRALAHGCGSKLSEGNERAGLCLWVVSTVRDLQTFDARAGRLKHWQPAAYDARDFSLVHNEIDDLAQEGALNELEALAVKHPVLRHFIYRRIVHVARASGKLEEARKIIEGYAPGTNEQKELIAEIESDKKRVGLTEERLAAIQPKLGEMPIRAQVEFFLLHANHLGGVDGKLAAKLLTQATQLIDMLKPGKEQTEARLALAMMYCFEKNDRGFAIMESLVPKLNELVETAAKLDGYETAYLRDGEWNMSATGTVGEILTRLSRAAGHFAWSDFDRAVSLASQFERAEIRLMAQLKLAQSILAGPPKRYAGPVYSEHAP